MAEAKVFFSNMERLLTGFVVNLNKRHKRYGHLFGNRCKSIVAGRGCLHWRIAVMKLRFSGAAVARYPGVTASLVNRMANEKEITGLDECLKSSL
jgi:hypothetical protein